MTVMLRFTRTNSFVHGIYLLLKVVTRDDVPPGFHDISKELENAVVHGGVHGGERGIVKQYNIFSFAKSMRWIAGLRNRSPCIGIVRCIDETGYSANNYDGMIIETVTPDFNLPATCHTMASALALA